jgi:hypothetical protein
MRWVDDGPPARDTGGNHDDLGELAARDVAVGPEVGPARAITRLPAAAGIATDDLRYGRADLLEPTARRCACKPGRARGGVACGTNKPSTSR